METSAKTGFNVKNFLIEAAEILYKDYLKYKENMYRSGIWDFINNQNKNDSRIINLKVDVTLVIFI